MQMSGQILGVNHLSIDVALVKLVGAGRVQIRDHVDEPYGESARSGRRGPAVDFPSVRIAYPLEEMASSGSERLAIA